jgi:hypothetical protein
MSNKNTPHSMISNDLISECPGASHSEHFQHAQSQSTSSNISVEEFYEMKRQMVAMARIIQLPQQSRMQESPINQQPIMQARSQMQQPLLMQQQLVQDQQQSM